MPELENKSYVQNILLAVDHKASKFINTLCLLNALNLQMPEDSSDSEDKAEYRKKEASSDDDDFEESEESGEDMEEEGVLVGVGPLFFFLCCFYFGHDKFNYAKCRNTGTLSRRSCRDKFSD